MNISFKTYYNIHYITLFISSKPKQLDTLHEYKNVSVFLSVVF